MTRPVINVEETVDRIVGKRTETPDGLSTATSRKVESPRPFWRMKAVTHREKDSLQRGEEPPAV